MKAPNSFQTQGQAQSVATRSSLSHNINAVLAIAYRDFLKILRDPARLVGLLVFPLIYIGFIGGGMQSAFGERIGYSYLPFVFTGVLAQTLFQAGVLEIVSLLEDRETDFSQEIFVSPISRYAIILGKVVGGALAALPQGVGVFLFAVMVLRVEVSLPQALEIAFLGLVVALYGGSFGMLILGLLPNRGAANRIFPFVLLPQFFTAGVFAPIENLPLPLHIISLISPMRYAVDLMRHCFFWGSPQYDQVVLQTPLLNAAVLSVTFLAFSVLGTLLFVRSERNR